MKESILIIIFFFIIFTFFCIHNNEVQYVESFIDKNQYLVRNLEDKDKAANMLADIKKRLLNILSYIEDNKSKDTDCIFIKQYCYNKIKKLNKTIIRESSQNSVYTSYSVNKGEELVFCLRSKQNTLHDINEIMYVAIHELAHIICPEIGHTQLFYKINRILLKYAIELNLYNYKNYSLYPEDYCGIKLSTNILN